jgi:putative ABC transport system permease protein
VVTARNLWNHKSFSIINILGLAMAMSACVFIFIYVHYETHHDTFWNNSDQIYRVVHDRYQNGALSFNSARAFYDMGRALKEKLPEVVNGTEIFRDIVTVSTPENRIQDISMFGAEESFFEVFQFPFVVKKATNPLTDLHSAILSESAAIKLFGDAQAIGKWFKVNEGWEFEVTGIFKDLPLNTHLSFDMLLSRKTYFYYFSKKGALGERADARDEAAFRVPKPVMDWDFGSQGHFAYLMLRPHSDPRQVEDKINQIKADYLKKITQDGTRIDFFLQPVRDIHLRSNRTGEVGTNGDYRSVLALSILGVGILLIAWINFVNLTLARSLERAKEVAIRKVNGATAGQIILMLTEEFATWVAVAFVIASPIAFLIMNSWLQNFAYRTHLSWITFAFAGLAALLIALVTVFHQAYAAATRNPVEALRYE